MKSITIKLFLDIFVNFQFSRYPVIIYSHGALAEWLREGLQNLRHEFEPRTRLQLIYNIACAILYVCHQNGIIEI